MGTYLLTVALNAAVDTTYLFEGFAVGDIHTVASLRKVAGGKANNVARVARSLGVNVVATGFAGGAAGTFIQEALGEAGIRADYEPIPGETRTCFALVDQKGHTLTEIREKGPAIGLEDAQAFLSRFEGLVAQASHVVISGSLPPGLPSDYYSHLVAIAKRAGVYTVVDASGAALRDTLPAAPDLVKPNRDELAGWLGRAVSGDRAELLAAAQAMRDAGPKAVAISLGEEGLLYVGPEGAWAARPPQVQAVNTVGSGDSLVAGFTVGLMQGLPVPEALKLGVAAGTANALTESVASPRTEDISTIRDQVTVEQLA